MVKINRHSIIIASQPQEAFKEIVRWGESLWWPKKSLMCFKRQTQGPVKEGTLYRQKVCLPFGPSWNATVTKLTGSSALCNKFSTVHKGVWGRTSPTLGGCSATKGSAEGGLAPIAEVRCNSSKLMSQRTSITRGFSDGMFEGHEAVSLVGCAGGCEVVYEMRYRLKGILNRLLWRLIFNKLHDQNIEMILRNLKEYLEKK